MEKWVSHRLDTDVQRSLTRMRRLKDVRYLAVMPDVHLANDICIGTVLATKSVVYPAAIGGDIGCGILAIRFDGDASFLDAESNAAKLLSRLYCSVPRNRHPQTSAVKTLPDTLLQWKLSDDRLEKMKQRDGRVQLGSLGRGNHFLEFQSDGEGQLWLMIHSGSRSLGQAITAHHLNGRPTRSIAGLEITEPEGQAYWNDMQWARSYAHANRASMMEAAAEILKAEWGISVDRSSLIHTDHNHADRETHFGEALVVHRKGAQCLAAGHAGIVPGSMATSSFLVVGRGCAKALESCSHGAGRKLSRTAARQSISVERFKKQMGSVWFDQRKSSGLRDESPGAYKDVRKVMKSQRELVSITSEHWPLLSFKGG